MTNNSGEVQKQREKADQRSAVIWHYLFIICVLYFYHRAKADGVDGSIIFEEGAQHLKHKGPFNPLMQE